MGGALRGTNDFPVKTAALKTILTADAGSVAFVTARIFRAGLRGENENDDRHRHRLTNFDHNMKTLRSKAYVKKYSEKVC